AKKTPEDILIQISIHNRGPEQAELHVLPTIWFRNQWDLHPGRDRPLLRQSTTIPKATVIDVIDPELAERWLYCEGEVPLLFTENETNTQRIFGVPNRSPYVKDGINDYIVNGQKQAVNPDKSGTKASAHYLITVPPGQSREIRLLLSQTAPSDFVRPKGAVVAVFGWSCEQTLEARRAEADQFYADIIPSNLSADAARVMRQALAGMLWSKQFYYYDVDKWLGERGSDPFSPMRETAPRNG